MIPADDIEDIDPGLARERTEQFGPVDNAIKELEDSVPPAGAQFMARVLLGLPIPVRRCPGG
jgi:hypothetical protein